MSPIPYGFSVSVSDGVIGVNGDTGDELWRYRRPGENATGTSVTPNGETVVVSYSAGEEETEDNADPPLLHEIVLIDSSSGDIKGTRVTEFVDMGIVANQVTSFASVSEQIGILSDDSRIIYRDNERNGTDVVSLDLENGEELWRISPTQSDGNADRIFVPRNAVVSRDVLILSSTFMDRSVISGPDAGERQDHMISLMGIDVATGTEIWRHELEVNAPIETLPFKLDVEQSSGMLTAVARSNNYHGEWILDPTNGEVLTDATFFTEQSDTVVGIMEEAIVSVREVSDGDEYEYSYSNLSGEIQKSINVEAPLERWQESFILTLEDSITWLDVNETGPSSWNQAQLVVTDWENGETRVVDLGIEVQRRPNDDGSLGTFAPTPTPVNMTLGPGALVITEDLMAENGEPRRIVGLVP
ncbi:PQQ-binding-like beta-propeller repeat protein [Nocardiopsis sp. NRRL B-16309]|uniref:PQQ-binding-like beta-propeller repeat protein n=1 Tax=Nocardiopsis sp. NRRL B-16309 TaxID=1519494 RepID=UPI0012E1FC29|nr:PQQ-binding-like beta-propeller repeat protein [Nocardiopsis sp. NRRL B-16309]